MCTTEDILEFPNENVKSNVEEIVRGENFSEFKLTVSSGSKKGDNYLGVIYRICATGLKDENESKLSLIVKLAPSYSRQKFAFDIFYKREINAYIKFLPTLTKLQDDFSLPADNKFKYVKYLGSDMTYMSEFLILEDVTAIGFKMGNRINSLDFNHMNLVIKNLAALHSLSFAMAQHNKSEHKDLMANIFGEEGYGVKEYSEFLDFMKDKVTVILQDDDHKQRFEAFGVDVSDKFMQFITPELTEPYNVLCHGDCWTNNIMFRYENDKPVEVRLLDWQMVKHASPIVDIAYLMFSSTDENLRANHYEELLNIYYDTLKTNLALMECDVNVCYPREIFEKQIKTIMPFGLIMAFLTAPMFMSEEEDIVDMNELMKKDQINEDDMQLKNEKSKSRYEERMRGVVRDFVRLGLI